MRINKSYFIYTIVFATLFASCKKDFLQKAPESNLAAGTIRTAADAENILTGAYNKLVTDGGYQYGQFFLSDGRSDNNYINGDNQDAEQPFENFTYTPSNSLSQGLWQGYYAHITAANAVTDNVTTIDDPSWAGTKRKEQILGEARYLRALAYYWLVTQWGDCPIILSVTNGDNFYPTRNSASEVYKVIIDDLKYAESVLDATPYKAQAGRATKGAAQALLAKTYAQMKDYANCLDYCKKVIAGPYSLVPNYGDIWGANHKNNSESIFELQVSSGGTPYSLWGVQIFAFVSSDGWPKRDIASYDLIQAFNAAGDAGPRYTATFNYRLTSASFNMPANAWNPAAPIPFMNKLRNPNGFASPENIILIRLADIILLAAEANNQLGNTGPAATLLNQVRTRAGLPNTTAITKSELALAILKERRLELVHEYTRWNDLLRADANGTINLVTLMNSQVNSNNVNLNYNMNADKHQFLLPVPLQDIQLNKNLTQNAGY